MTKKTTNLIEEKIYKVNETPKVYISKETYNKIIYIRDKYDFEISGFGILSSYDPIVIDDFRIIKQESTFGSTDINDKAMAEFAEDYLEVGYEPWQIMRTWIHTHPKGVTSPSSTDYQTFARCFGNGDWGIMMIFVKSGEIICDIHINKPLKMKIPAKLIILDEEIEEYDQEVKDNVKELVIVTPNVTSYKYSPYNKTIQPKLLDEMDEEELNAIYAQDIFADDGYWGGEYFAK